ncbi:hypothetical protein CDD82_6343 [Ophiocordyceps australis]|uniref:Uncharacterized protein n=1 Tax=Ophiocordyceps australis TaxID=1399860 RepID=A0A2C5Y0Y7_9HYPO|nr:hypothetical protein CDD82_6343 [Ophiocordyceps australis]
MNWTEGSLARHSKGKHYKEEDARQREHFAKARSLHQGGVLASAPESSSTSAGVSNFVPDFISSANRVGQSQPPMEPQYFINSQNLAASQQQTLLSIQNYFSYPNSSDNQAIGQMPLVQPRTNAEFVLKGASPQQQGISNDLAATKMRLLEKSDWAGIKSLSGLPMQSFHQKLGGVPVSGWLTKFDNGNATAQSFTNAALKTRMPLPNPSWVGQRPHLAHFDQNNCSAKKSNLVFLDEGIKHFGKRQNIVA